MQQKTFKDRVYAIVKKIPKGRVATYQQVASLAGNPRAARAVGQILARSRGIPCHRVIKSNNEVGGYFGSMKRQNQKIKKLVAEGIRINPRNKKVART